MMFENPEFLLLLLLIPLFVYVYYLMDKKKKKIVMKFSSVNKIKKKVSKKVLFRRHLPFVLICLALIFMSIGFSNPHIPWKRTHEGVNVVLSIDVSGSMENTDFKPNRLEAAKRNAQFFVDNLEPKDLIGSVIFGSGVSTNSYLTNYKNRVKNNIESIKLKYKMGFFGGCEGISCETHIGDGLAMAIDMAVSIVNKKKFVVFMSDGANTGGAVSPDDAINYAKINDVQVFVIGIGKDKVDAHGRVLLDEPLLKKIAMETKGKYFNAIDDKSLEAIYESINEDIEREKELVNVKDLFFAGSFVILTLFLFFVYVKFRIIV